MGNSPKLELKSGEDKPLLLNPARPIRPELKRRKVALPGSCSTSLAGSFACHLTVHRVLVF